MNDITPNLKSILANTSLFKMLNERQLDEIVANTSSMRVSQNMCIVNQGNEKTLEILGQSMCFGLGEILLERPHQAFVKATTDSMLLHTDRDAMLQIAKEDFGFARELMTCVGRQFYGLVRDIESYSQTARQRLAGYLLRKAGARPAMILNWLPTRRSLLPGSA